MTDSETETPDDAPACSAKVVEAGGKRRKPCPQPVVFRWRAFERPGVMATEAQRAATAAKPPAAEGYACAMHRETAWLPDADDMSPATWRGKYELRLSLIGAVRP